MNFHDKASRLPYKGRVFVSSMENAALFAY